MDQEFNIGKGIRCVRQMKGYRYQANLCEDANLNKSWLCDIENGKKTPTLAYLKRLADFLEVPMFFFFWFNDIPEELVSKEMKYTLKVMKPKMDEILKEIFQETLT